MSIDENKNELIGNLIQLFYLKVNELIQANSERSGLGLQSSQGHNLNKKITQLTENKQVVFFLF